MAAGEKQGGVQVLIEVKAVVSRRGRMASRVNQEIDPHRYRLLHEAGCGGIRDQQYLNLVDLRDCVSY